jgi:hypothetical protein
MTRYRTSLLAFLILLASGCATLCPTKTQIFTGRSEECQRFLHGLDRHIQKAGVKDHSTCSVPCFPYLRSNRFLSALKNTLKSDAEREYCLRWMQELDLKARRKEIRNLPDEVVLSQKLMEGQRLGHRELYNRVECCSRKLLDHDKGQPDFYETLYSFVHVPDQYSFLMRAAGLYPLASIPVTILTASAREEFRSWFNADPEDLPIEGNLVRFSPANGAFLRTTEIEKIIRESTTNPLNIPRLDAAQQKRFVAHFAPIFIQDVAAPYDRFGRVAWEGNRLGIKTDDPVVYWYISHAFFKGEPILQVNYVIWYTERAGRRSPWIERGPLDGLTARISLDTQGRPFMVDVMNNCGCYHLFSPRRDRVSRIVSKRFRLDPFVPQWLPKIPFGKRLGIRVNSGWHQIERLLSTALPPEAVPYKLIPYGDLETLPTEDCKSESMFDAEGIAKDSERIEPFILFPMGVPSVGSMRQRGNHPISLTGRVHFDDPYLFDHNFVFK